MSISADAHRPPRHRPPACAGFTLLEVLVTLGIVAVAIVPLLVVRDAAWNVAYRSEHMLKAAAYAEAILAERMTDPDDVKELQAVIEDDPAFHYELTIEHYDLATGRVEVPGDETAGGSEFTADSAFAPPDAGGPLEDEEDLDDPQRVRRFRLKVLYPSMDEDEEGEYLLEGYLPLTRKEPTDGMPAAK
jgi:prepilin-type N-terminal cleavage/methylation domain-containing protein